MEKFLQGMKAQKDEGNGRILLGDNTGGGAVMLRSIKFRVLEVGFQLGSLAYIYTYMHPFTTAAGSCGT
jgi:hypothetical protein